MKQKAHLRITKVQSNEKRHKITYYFSDGREIVVYFVGNLRAAWQPSHFLYLHSCWLASEGGTRLIAGITHDPSALEPSAECYFFGGDDGFRQENFAPYLEAVNRRVHRSWGKAKEFEWLAGESVLTGWSILLRKLNAHEIPLLPADLIASALPRIT